MSRFQVPANAGEERRKEKVELAWGDIWVWGMTAAEALRTIERASRPSFDPRGGIDQAESILTQIMVSCYHGDKVGAELVFTDANILDIYKLPAGDFEKLCSAIGKVNGKDAEEVEGLRAFFEETAASSSSE